MKVGGRVEVRVALGSGVANGCGGASPDELGEEGSQKT